VNGQPGSPFGNRFLFTGREWLSDLKLYDYRNRMYQPELGRFLQPDPKEFGAGDYNLYRYCHNDPINHSDPMGLYAPDIRGFSDEDAKKVQAQMDQLKDKSQAFRDQFKKWEGDKEKREIRPASDPGNFKGRNQGPTRNGPGNSTERQGILGRIASWLRGGEGRGGTIYFNPNNRATAAPGSDRAPVFGLAHEFGHLIDIGNGNYPSSLVPSAAETRAGENTAIGWENEARSSIGGVDLRPYQ
jgi:RHS repeat-associated protein